MTKWPLPQKEAKHTVFVSGLGRQRLEIRVETMEKQINLRHSFLPALDNLLSADLELEGLVSVSRRVKFLPILQHP